MARPIKEGIDYFTLDSKFDDEITIILSRFGAGGIGILVILWQIIYNSGYYIMWTEKELLLYNNRFNAEVSLVSDVIKECIKWGIFNRDLYEKYSILTSRGIQKRFIEATIRRKEVTFIREFFLINLREQQYEKYLKNVNVSIYSINDNINSKNADISTQREKEKEIEIEKEKEKEIESQAEIEISVETPTEKSVKKSVEESVEGLHDDNSHLDIEEGEPSLSDESDPPSLKARIPYQKVLDEFNKKCVSLPPVCSLTDKRRKAISARVREHGIECVNKAIERASRSDFLAGQNSKGWTASFDWIFKPNNFVKVLEGNYDHNRASPNTCKVSQFVSRATQKTNFQQRDYDDEFYNTLDRRM